VLQYRVGIGGICGFFYDDERLHGVERFPMEQLDGRPDLFVGVYGEQQRPV